MCTDPKLIRNAITQKPDEVFSVMSISTFKGKMISFFVNDSLFDSLWKAIDFVYDPVSFNRYDPIVSVCYEMNIPNSLQMEGIQFIHIKITNKAADSYDFMKISPPGYLHQNVEIRTRTFKSGNDVTFELDYQIDNVLKVGDEYCNPDPSFIRDECVTEQLLNVRNTYDVISTLKESIFSEFNQTLWVHTTFVG